MFQRIFLHKRSVLSIQQKPSVYMYQLPVIDTHTNETFETTRNSSLNDLLVFVCEKRELFVEYNINSSSIFNDENCV